MVVRDIRVSEHRSPTEGEGVTINLLGNHVGVGQRKVSSRYFL